MPAAAQDALYRLLDTPPEREFDDIVRLASRLCGAPTALVSLLDGDRQWFKARVGFEATETTLQGSVCRHVVAAQATLVIPDLTADSRTRDNPLVTDDPALRFYAGAPLTTRSGTLGALCVIDTKPRPDGLSAQERDDLECLARQVVSLIEARRDAAALQHALAERDAADEIRRMLEGRWQDLYQNMQQGFVYALALRDASGQATDWRYIDVNNAWGELIGIDPAVARGQTVRALLPGLAEDWLQKLLSVVDTHEPVRFTRQVGKQDRWYDGTAQWVGRDYFTIIFNEVTDRVAAERRRDALLTLGDTLRDCDSVEAMVRQAARIVGETLGAVRAAYGEMDAERLTVELAPGWSLPGTVGIAGRHVIERYGRISEDLLDGRAFVANDVDVDPRTSGFLSSWHAIETRAAAIVPVLDRGRAVAMLVAHLAEPHHWQTDEIAFLRNAADRLEIGIARIRAEARQALLNTELSHRMKNTLSMVQAIASQTLSGAENREAVDGFNSRLVSLASAHDVLLMREWTAADFGEVARLVLATFDKDGRIRLDGPELEIGPRATLSLSLLLHELATNAAKYGALSVPGGVVTLRWTLTEAAAGAEAPTEVPTDVPTGTRAGARADARAVDVTWTERGGPPAEVPTRRGFGSRLIRMGLIGSGGVTLQYEAEGLSAIMTAPVYQMQQS